MLSFVCSIGNVPLAAVLWNGGISFGGVVSFIFADLIITPILIIYQKYYGTKMVLLGTFYATMLVIWFYRRGGRQMMSMMGGGPDDMAHHDHGSPFGSEERRPRPT